MYILRLFIAVISLGLALFCGWVAYQIHHWNSSPKDWLLSGPINVCGYNVDPGTGIAALGFLAIALACVAIYTFFGFKSDN
jgi:hypothetical protein